MAQAPLHAAGDHVYESTENTLSHVVSSFVPTIKALDSTQKKAWNLHDARNRNAILIVTMPKTLGYANLRADQEVAAIKQLVDGFATMILENPSKDAVVRELEGCIVAHFACHGYANPDEPSDSALILCKNTTEALTICTRLPAQVAYLSLALDPYI